MSWWKTAKPGDKVVCVCEDHDRVLRVGEVYVLSEIRYIPNCVDGMTGKPDGTEFGVRVVGVPNRTKGAYFKPTRFRPVQTKSTETGMAILKRILNSAPVREDA